MKHNRKKPDMGIKKGAFVFITGIFLLSLANSLSFASTAAFNTKIEKAVIQGRRYLENEEYGKAAAFFNDLLREYPENPDLNYCLGFVYYKSGDYRSAEKNFKRTIELDEKYVEAYYFLAIIYEKMGEKEKVIEYLNKVIYLDPGFQSAYYNKGVLFLSLNDPERAIKDFAYALYLSPKDNSSVIGILKAYDKMGMMDSLAMSVHEDEEKTRKISPEKEIEPAEVSAPVEKTDEAVRKEEGVLSGVKEESRTAEEDRKENKAVEIEEVKSVEKVSEDADEETRIRENMKITVYSPEGWEKTILSNRQRINIKSYKDKSGMLEINFSKPVDLKGKYLYFDIKGDKGGEVLKGFIKDNLTKRSPEFPVFNIYTDWRTKTISIEDSAQGFLNEENIVQIKFKLVNDGDSREKVSIKNIRIK